jgi:hypothetical protein
MPYSSIFDPVTGVIFSVGSGRVTGDELLRELAAISRDPQFRSDMRMLVDLTAANRIELSAEKLEMIATASPFSAESRQAFVVRRDLDFGLARMYAAYAEMRKKGEVQVFRSGTEALKWLHADVRERCAAGSRV